MTKEKGYLLLEYILAMIILSITLPTLSALFSKTTSLFSNLYTTFQTDADISFFTQQLSMDSDLIRTCTLSDNTIFMVLINETSLSYRFYSNYIKRVENGSYTTNIPMPEYSVEELSVTDHLLHLVLSFTEDSPLEIKHSF